MARTAVILFNLGGPDSLDAVRPFLFNLFNDPAIIGVPQPLRWLLAQVISRRRAPVAQEIYSQLGGRSPLLDLTLAQATALEAALGPEHRVFVCMRYWHPMATEVAREVKAWGADRIVLLPLYPQYSTTTSGSSLADWTRAAKAAGVTAPARAVCCYPTEAGFVASVAALTRSAHDAAAAAGIPRVLFSAHGLPKKVVDAGDPYQRHVEQSAAAVAQALGIDGLDWRVSYQSRVGPLEWIGPATDDEIRRAGAEGRPLVVVPIAFVSEHSETLVELDIEYRHLAETAGVPAYHRVPAVGTATAFIDGLAGLVSQAAADRRPIAAGGGCRRCPADRVRCPMAEEGQGC